MPRRAVLSMLSIVLIAGCAHALSPRQALTWDAYKECQRVGLSAKLERLQEDGGWDLTGREGEIQRVSDCMTEYWERAAREGRVPALPASRTVTPVKA